MSLLKESRFLKALHRNNQGESPPVWLMRQAGRILPAYRNLRRSHSLGELFRTPKKAALVTQLPLEELAVDAAIIFSDILLIYEALGGEVTYPQEGRPLVRFRALSLPNEQEVLQKLSYVGEAIVLAKASLNIPLLGFCGAPFTVLSFAFSQEELQNLLQNHPEKIDELLHKLCTASLFYLKMQIQAGVDAIQIFESRSTLLDLRGLERFSFPYLRQMADLARSFHTPCILFARSMSTFPQNFSTLGATCLSFDEGEPLWQLQKTIDPSLAIQGNFAPELLKERPEIFLPQLDELLLQMRGSPHFIANLGHGVLPDTPLEHVRLFVDRIRQF
jgi:uroporphyrinogen decarboxylase